MAVYRFRVILEDEEEVSRVIEIRSSQTFQHLHDGIMKGFAVPVPGAATIFVTDNEWHKEDKIGVYSADEPDNNPKISAHVHDPHQRFIYELEAGIFLSFTVELIKILGDNPSADLPETVGGEGDIPKYYFKQPAPVESTEDEASGEAALLKELANMAMAGLGDDDEPDDDDLDDIDMDDDSDDDDKPSAKKGSKASDDDDDDFDEGDDDDDDEFGFGDSYDESELDGFGEEEDYRE